MSLPRSRALVFSSFVLALFAGCATGSSSSGEGGANTGAGQGGTITGAGGSGGTSTSAKASASVSASSASSASSSASGGGEGGGGGQSCVNTDPGEPNDKEASAYDFGTIGCYDDKPGTIYGVIAGAGDVDWFVYHGLDEDFCQVNPTSGVKVTTGIARVCAYFECVAGADKTEVGSCPNGTSTDTSPDGRPGCCGTTDFTVDVNCADTINDESLVFLRVDDPTHGACVEYTLTFHY